MDNDCYTNLLVDLDAMGGSPDALTVPTDALYQHCQPVDLVLELGVAVVMNDHERVNYLLNMGADPKARNAEGRSALDLADAMNRVDIVKCLLRDVDLVNFGLVELLYAFMAGKSTVVRALLEMGLDYELEDEILYRGIFLFACASSTTDTVETLYRYGPPIDVYAIEDALVRLCRDCNRVETANLLTHIAEEQSRARIEELPNDEIINPLSEFTNDRAGPGELGFEVIFD